MSDENKLPPAEPTPETAIVPAGSVAIEPSGDKPAEKPEAPAEDQADKKDDELGGKMSFMEHLEELRRRIIVTAVTISLVCLFIYSSGEVDTIAFYFMKPLQDVVKKYGHFMFTSMAEGFMFNMKMAAIAAVFISMPMIFYQLWAFIAPGLYKRERSYVGPFIILASLSFATGAAFFYFVAFPMGAQFFASFAKPGWIEFNPKLEDTFSFVVMMVFCFGFIFELPVIAFLLARIGIINIRLLNKYRKYAILIIFIIAAIITPPDVVSQLLVAFPMWGLYEISALVVWIFGPRAKKAEATDSDEADAEPSE